MSIDVKWKIFHQHIFFAGSVVFFTYLIRYDDLLGN